MAVRRLAVLSAALVFSHAGAAVAADPVVPRANVILSGQIKFPRAQPMYVQTGAKNSSRLTVALGFHGRCKGGGLKELWSGNVAAKPVLRVRDGRFEGTLKGVSRNLGGGRSGHFKWTFKGRFTERSVAIGTVSGTAEIRAGGKTVSRCKTSTPASVRLTA
jgi:hypothetical protein